MTGITVLPPAKLAAHEAAVARLRDAYAAVPPGVPVRLAKPTSNLFRYSRDAAKPGQPVVVFSTNAAPLSRLLTKRASSIVATSHVVFSLSRPAMIAAIIGSDIAPEFEVFCPPA